jgi:hypothetical protein
MRAAPPVDVPLSAAGPERAVCALLYALAALGTSVALASALDFGSPRWLAAAAAVCAAPVGALAWRPPRGRLRWDGRVWTRLQPSGQLERVDRLQLQLDFGAWVLLRWQAEGQRRPTWAALRAADAGAAWHGLRVALAAHAGAPHPQASA